MATLVYSDANGVDRSFALGAEPVMVGRGAECAIRSDDPRVSRVHARFFVDQGALWVEDLGSSNGIYVGPNKVQRAPVPTGEIILVGSLMIRLLPASGTLPPPVGLHGTLATWLDLERKTRVAVEEERDAFAKRVGELHQQLAQHVVDGQTLRPEDLPGDTQLGMAAEAFRLRDEAEARVAALEQTLAAVQDEVEVLRTAGGGAAAHDLARLRDELATARDRVVVLEREVAERAEWSSNIDTESTKMVQEVSRLQGALDEAEAARSIAEHAHGEAMREAQLVRDELHKMRRSSAAELEIARLESAKSKESRAMAETAAGVAVAEKLAEADVVIGTLRRELADARAAAAGWASGPDARLQELTELVTVVTARAEKAEKELASSQIRAQGAERNLSGANAQAAKAETRAAQLANTITDLEARAKGGDDELAKARERIAALETRLGAGDAPVQAAEARAAKLAAELVDVKTQLETSRGRVVELEQAAATAQQAVTDVEARAAAAQAELGSAAVKLAEADTRANELQAKLDQLAQAEVAIASATKHRDDAAARASAAENSVADAKRRAEDAEKRASAADTMAKAMAKDVAEALRRAVDADTQRRNTSRELAELMRRAEQAEAKNATAATEIGEAQARAAEAEARIAQIQKELTEKLEATHAELTATLQATQQDLTTRLEAAQRELAAERSTSLALVDRKTQLERELAEARAQVVALMARAEGAERRVVEHEVQIESLQDRVDDLESGMAVSETAQQASLAEARDQIASLKLALNDSKVEAGKGADLVVQLRTQVGELEAKLAEIEQAHAAAEAALREAQHEIGALVQVAKEREGSSEGEAERLRDALARATEAERRADALAAKAEAADLAIGRSGALQRQLDEALSKLTWLEREASTKTRDSGRAAAVEPPSDAITNDRIAAAENKAAEAAARAKELEARAAETDRRAAQAKQDAEALAEQLAELQRRTQRAEQTNQTKLANESRLAEAERRAEAAEMQLAAAEQRIAVASTFERQLFDAQAKIAQLEREVENADNVRSFAAETEREIAQLQRELRETRSRLTQASLERDRLAADLRSVRGDSETTSRRAPLAKNRLDTERPYDPEVTAQADLSKYEPIIAKATELQGRVQELEHQGAALRKQLADTEERLRAAIDGDDDADSTHTGSQLPIAFHEHLGILEESIDSLRANMRAASDETAMMEQSDSVVAVSSAVSQAAEHIERARAAIRAMAASLDH